MEYKKIAKMKKILILSLIFIFAATVVDAQWNCLRRACIGCPPTESFACPFEINESVSPASCGVADGSIIINASGGRSAYSYAWGNGATTNMLSGLEAGIYDVTVTDANGCNTNKSILLESSPTFAVSCNDDITLSIIGGTAPFDFKWSNGNTTNQVQLGEQVIVTDANGCVAVQECGCQNIGEICDDGDACTSGETYDNDCNCNGGVAMSVSVPSNLVACIDDYDISDPNNLIISYNGQVDITVNNGVAPFSYNWQPNGLLGSLDGNAANSEDLLNVSSGVYDLRVTDASGCEINTFAAVDNSPPNASDFDNTTTSPSCQTGCDGSINVFSTSSFVITTVKWRIQLNGTSNFILLPNTGPTVNDLCAGDYIEGYIEWDNGCWTGIASGVIGQNVPCN